MNIWKQTKHAPFWHQSFLEVVGHMLDGRAEPGLYPQTEMETAEKWYERSLYAMTQVACWFQLTFQLNSLDSNFQWAVSNLFSNLGMSENGVYPQWNSHLVGIMISKTIGCRGTRHFQTNPLGPSSGFLFYVAPRLHVALPARLATHTKAHPADGYRALALLEDALPGTTGFTHWASWGFTSRTLGLKECWFSTCKSL